MARRIYCGINTDPTNPLGNPSPDEIRALGADWVRFTFKDPQDAPQPTTFALYDDLVQRLRSTGIHILLILSYETYPGKWECDADETRWDAYIQKFANRCRQVAEHYGDKVQAYEIWNEPDLAPQPGYNPYVPPRIFGRLMRAARDAIRSVRSIPVVLGGLGAGQPGYLHDVQAGSGGVLHADAVGVHPYGRRPTDNWPSPTWGIFGPGLIGLLQQYYAAANKPLWITEMGCDDLAVQGQFPERTFESVNTNLVGIVPAVFWYCWSDRMVAPWGLLEGSGTKKPAYDSFRAFARQPYAGEAIGPSTTALEMQLLQQAQAQQKIQFNPQAALQARIFLDGLVPNSGEFDVLLGAATYRAQRAEHLGTGEVRVYFCQVPLWGQIWFVSPPSQVEAQVEVIDRPSLYQDSRGGQKPRYIIVHTTESPVGVPAENTLKFLVGPNDRGVSVHELAMPDGKVYRMVPDDVLAHHARSAQVRFPDNTPWQFANHITWGIEGYQVAGRAVSQEVLALMKVRVAAACKRLGLEYTRVLGHREIDPDRKSDPVGVSSMDDFRASIADLLLQEALLTASTTHQLMRFNPTASLQRQIFADHFAPNSDEFEVQFNGATYRAQRAEDLGTGKVRLYYCKVPDWWNVLYVERAGG
jgi:N-acetyl-anhydromuramyl-L-alanine amidase AmpD